MGRTAETKVNLESARDFTYVDNNNNNNNNDDDDDDKIVLTRRNVFN